MLGFLWVLSDFTVKYFIYVKQSNYSTAEVFEWGVIEMDEDNFVVCADFRFHTDGTEVHTSQYLFEKTPFSTEASAESAINSYRDQEWKCYWYGSAEDPKASMERLFPYKELFYSVIALGVLLYFAYLKKQHILSQE